MPNLYEEVKLGNDGLSRRNALSDFSDTNYQQQRDLGGQFTGFNMQPVQFSNSEMNMHPGASVDFRRKKSVKFIPDDISAHPNRVFNRTDGFADNDNNVPR